MASRSSPVSSRRRTPAPSSRGTEASSSGRAVPSTSSRCPDTVPATNSSRSREPASAQCRSSRTTSTPAAPARVTIACATPANNSGREGKRPGSSSPAPRPRPVRTCDQGQNGGASAAGQRPQATSSPAFRADSSAASARVVFPIPASPTISATRPRPAVASTTRSARLPSSGSRPTIGWSLLTPARPHARQRVRPDNGSDSRCPGSSAMARPRTSPEIRDASSVPPPPTPRHRKPENPPTDQALGRPMPSVCAHWWLPRPDRVVARRSGRNAAGARVVCIASFRKSNRQR